MAVVKIRQSMLGNFDACPRRLQYSLESPPDQYFSGIVRAVGVAYHAGQEYYYLMRQADRYWDWNTNLYNLNDIQDMAISALNDEIEKAGDNFLWDEKFPTFDDAATAIKSMLGRYFEDGHAWPADWTVLAVEQYFELPFYTAHTRTGTIDLVLQDPAGYVVGVDHKTAGRMWDQHKHKPRKNNQACFYTAALQELYPDAPGHRFVYDIMTYAGKFERRISDPQPAHVEATLDKAIQVIALYEGMRKNGLDLPANPSSTLCSARYCDFWDICPHGAALDGSEPFFSAAE